MARKLIVEIVGDASSLHKAYGKATNSSHGFAKSLGTVAKAGVLAAGAAGVGALFVTLRSGIKEFTQSAKVAAQTEAVIKSTGGSANVTAKHVDDLAKSIMRYSGIDDEAVKAGENMLLTFTNIRNEVGRGNDIFDQSTKTLLDMSTALGGDAASNAVRLGKALNDPIKGVTALRKVGVAFTEDQTKLIKKLVESGHTMDAQKLILKELNKEFGGSAKAVGETLPGQLNLLKEQFNNFAGDLVGTVTPALLDFTKKFNKADGFKAKIGVIFTGMKEGLKDLKEALFGGMKRIAGVGGGAGVVVPFDGIIQKGIRSVDWDEVGRQVMGGISKGLSKTAQLAGKLVDIFNKAVDRIPWEQLGDKIGPGFASALVVGLATMLDPAFWAHHWEEMISIALALFPLGKLLSGLGRIGKLLLEPLVGPLRSLLPEAWSAVAKLAGDLFINVLSKLPAKAGEIMLNVVLRTAQTLGRLPEVAQEAIKSLMESVAEHLGPFARTFLKFLAFDVIVHGVEAGVTAIVGWFGRLPGLIGSAFQSGWQAVREGIGNAWEWLKGKAAEVIGNVVGLFRSLPRRIGDAISGAMDDLKDMIGRIFAWKKILGWVKDALDFHSPAPWAVQVGKDIVGSIAHGVGAAGGVLKDAVFGLAKQFAGSVFGGGGGLLDRAVGAGSGSYAHGLSAQVNRATNYAYQHGWHGKIISGFRTRQEQEGLYARYVASGYDPRYIAARPGTSSHESGNAVDVSDAATFDRIMASAPPYARLMNNVPGDFSHFSVSGRASGGPVLQGQMYMVGEQGKELFVPEQNGTIVPMGGRNKLNLVTQGQALGTSFKQGLMNTLTPTTILRPLALAKANADEFVDGEGVKNMTGEGEKMGTAFALGLGSTRAQVVKTALGVLGAAGNPLGIGALGKGSYPGDDTLPGGIHGTVAPGRGDMNVTVVVHGSVMTERDLAITVRDQLVQAGFRSGGGILKGQA